jgi:hypothetical protein
MVPEAEVERTAHDLYDLISSESGSLELAGVLFPGIRKLAEILVQTTPRVEQNWFSASSFVHAQTLAFARFLNQDLGVIAQSFYATHEALFSPEMTRVYRKDLERYKRAAESFFAIASEQMGKEAILARDSLI